MSALGVRLTRQRFRHGVTAWSVGKGLDLAFLSFTLGAFSNRLADRAGLKPEREALRP